MGTLLLHRRVQLLLRATQTVRPRTLLRTPASVRATGQPGDPEQMRDREFLLRRDTTFHNTRPGDTVWFNGAVLAHD
jgi:hypothetical protein